MEWQTKKNPWVVFGQSDFAVFTMEFQKVKPQHINDALVIQTHLQHLHFYFWQLWALREVVFEVASGFRTKNLPSEDSSTAGSFFVDFPFLLKGWTQHPKSHELRNWSCLGMMLLVHFGLVPQKHEVKRKQVQLMVNWLFGLVVLISGIPLWKGLLFGGIPRVPNHQLIITYS